VRNLIHTLDLGEFQPVMEANEKDELETAKAPDILVFDMEGLPLVSIEVR
jgi:hypothetical protein